jgi:hypothetical protein
MSTMVKCQLLASFLSPFDAEVYENMKPIVQHAALATLCSEQTAG